MKDIIERVLERVPDYKEFMTIDELNRSSMGLVKEYPDIVSTFEFGVTRKGEKITGLKIGEGSKNALVYGFPHPNEPIGTMTMEFLSRELASNKELRDRLDYTWYFVKAWDTDGARLNEKWFKGPFTLYNYARNFFRPAGHQQVDWTFPIEYKNLKFDKTIPESESMMALIDEIKPVFIYSLHNSGFGGVYWYFTKDIPEVYEAIKNAAARQNVPLSLGEPETSFNETFAPAIYKILSTQDEYDYYEKYGAEHPEQLIKYGTCSAEYAKSKYDSFTMLTELPYFFNEKITDLSETEIERGEAIRENLNNYREFEKFVVASLERSKPYVDEKNQFKLALEAFTGNDGNIDAMIKQTYEDPAFSRKATVAEEFDNKWMSQFGRMLTLGLLIRLNESELENASSEGKKVLEAEKEAAEKKLTEISDFLEKNMDYGVVPIKKLVSIQTECGLIVADHIGRK